MNRFNDVNRIYSQLVDLLSLSQFEKIMFQGDSKNRAYIAKKVSKSKKVHVLADSLIEAYNKAVLK